MTSEISADAAIKAALQQNWNEAIQINSEILKTDKKNVDAINRLGFAYLQIGNVEEAQKNFRKVLTIDKYNKIADKNLSKMASPRSKIQNSTHIPQVSPISFLEEPGKTKIVNCINLAPVKQLSQISNGEEVFLKVKKHDVEIRDASDMYLGALPDDISFKLIKFIAGGNKYRIIIRSNGKNSLTVFIREISRGKKFMHQPSFTASSNFIPSSRVSISETDKPDMTATGEDEETTETDEET